MLLALVAGMTMFMSCSKDDDDDGNSGKPDSSISGGNDNTPRYERRECTSCRGTGDCKMAGLGCNGTGDCGGCNGRGYTGSGSFTIRCIRCNGKGTCKYCNGSGICSTCDGYGYKDVEVKPTNNSDDDNNYSNDYVSIKALKILAVKLSSGEWTYSASVVSMYKKERFDGEMILYTSSKNIVGIADDNSDRKCGDTNVSGYTYKVLTNVSLNSKTYYYFN